jgi:hypothetical protein
VGAIFTGGGGTGAAVGASSGAVVAGIVVAGGSWAQPASTAAATTAIHRTCDPTAPIIAARVDSPRAQLAEPGAGNALLRASECGVKCTRWIEGARVETSACPGRQQRSDCRRMGSAFVRRIMSHPA